METSYEKRMQALKKLAFEANMFLSSYGLATLTWGNASVRDKKRDRVAIKPSGVAYAALTPEAMVVIDTHGKVVEGALRPSSDTPTHLFLYRAFPEIGSIVHTHSRWATIWSQMQRPIPVLGTTHADHFNGEVPCTRPLTVKETAGEYEKATGEAIAEAFASLDPLCLPAALVAGHGPFVWGRDWKSAVANAVALEEVAMMAWHTLMARPDASLPLHIAVRHFARKHGSDATYGQKQS